MNREELISILKESPEEKVYVELNGITYPIKFVKHFKAKYTDNAVILVCKDIVIKSEGVKEIYDWKE